MREKIKRLILEGKTDEEIVNEVLKINSSEYSRSFEKLMYEEYLNEIVEKDPLKIYDIYYDGDWCYAAENSQYMIDKFINDLDRDEIAKSAGIYRKDYKDEDDYEDAIDKIINKINKMNSAHIINKYWFGNCKDFVEKYLEKRYVKELANNIKSRINEYKNDILHYIIEDKAFLRNFLNDIYDEYPEDVSKFINDYQLKI